MVDKNRPEMPWIASLTSVFSEDQKQAIARSSHSNFMLPSTQAYPQLVRGGTPMNCGGEQDQPGAEHVHPVRLTRLAVSILAGFSDLRMDL